MYSILKYISEYIHSLQYIPKYILKYI